MPTLKDIEALNIEISSKCNANCTFCMRKQKVRPYGDHFITRSDFKRLPVSFLKQLLRISFGGSFGDLSCNPDAVDIAAYVRELNQNLKLEGDTNGSNQDKGWWKALGTSFHRGGMVFALDGLSDTHAVYRRGTDFNKIIGNIRAFASSGGLAYWKFIAFEHNEHQIKAAEALAKDIGCKGFFVISSRDYEASYRRPKSLNFRIKRDIFKAYRDSLKDEERQAVCRPLSNKSIYIAADGSVHPCCFAHCMYITEHNQQFRFVVPLIEKYRAEINFITTPVEQIINGGYFTEVMKLSRTNSYCMTKCNKHRKLIRKELVLYEALFD
jgi:MoaA/NifB/PqqE/SkfB family radical SAM enzyme